ncbi:MAG: IS110 family transposase [Devosia nanyangense]|uniref:IS110 family transposase n=1 Tax=Devosia nanyangense TaxID=1228055 RepID=A0A933P035_9HYPH|nr:IS110 family transposase [Devosia nanyangense]
MAGLAGKGRGQAWPCLLFAEPEQLGGPEPALQARESLEMLAHDEVAGIDVGKMRLDVHVAGVAEGFWTGNDGRGIRDLIVRLRRLKVRRVGIEASGGYERGVAVALSTAGFKVVLCDPAQVRNFARAMKVRAKTDPIDARMIARYLMAAGDLPLYQPDALRDRLGELVNMRRHLIAERSELAAKTDQIADPMLARLLRRRLRQLAADLELVELEIRRHIQSHAELSQRAKALMAVPGVGPVLSTILIAELPELGAIGARQIASLVGVAPHPRQSGLADRGGKCSGGRTRVRTVLYMACLSALKARHSRLYPFYERLRANGKPFKLAITAVMRKFLTILNAITRDSAAYRPT